MPIKFPDILQHNNQKYPIIDANDIKGIHIVNDIFKKESLLSIDIEKRSVGSIVSFVGDSSVRQYVGENTYDANWCNLSNWVSISVSFPENLIKVYSEISNNTFPVAWDSTSNANKFVAYNNVICTYVSDGTSYGDIDGKTIFGTSNGGSSRYISLTSYSGEGTSPVSIQKQTTPETGFSATYWLIDKQGKKQGDSINIPVDRVVKNAELKTVTEEGVPYPSAHVGDKYVEITFENVETPLYVPVNDLVDIYKPGNGISIDATNNISIQLDGSNTNGLNLGTSGLGIDVAKVEYDDEWVSNTGVMSDNDASKLLALSSISNLNKISDQLYEATAEYLDYDRAVQYFDATNHYNYAYGTSVKAGVYYGHNYDSKYNNDVTFAIHTAGTSVKYKSVGFAAISSILSSEEMASFDPSRADMSGYMSVLPFYMISGMNEKGLVCSMTSVKKNDSYSSGSTTGLNTGTNPGADKSLPITMIVRYLLDRCSTPSQGASLLSEYNIYSPSDADVDYHFMIADATSAYLLEFVSTDGTGVCSMSYTPMQNSTTLSGKTWITDFILKNASLGSSTKFDSSNCSTIPEHSKGVERWNIINDQFSTITSYASMLSFMSNTLKASLMYNSESNWYTEYTIYDDDYTVAAAFTTPSVYDTVIAEKTAQHTSEVSGGRNKLNQSFETAHTVVYDINNKTLSVIINENEKSLGEISIALNGATSVNEYTFVFKDNLETTTGIGTVAKPTSGTAVIQAAGKTFKEVWNTIFMEKINPTITQPSATISFTNCNLTSQEVGTSLATNASGVGYSAVYKNATYTYGPAVGDKLDAWNITFNGETYTDGSHSLGTVTAKPAKQTISCTFNWVPTNAETGYAYAKNNLGEVTEIRLANGSKTIEASIPAGYYNVFCGYTNETLDTITSDVIRNTTASYGKAVKEASASSGIKTDTYSGSTAFYGYYIAYRADFDKVLDTIISNNNDNITDSGSITDFIVKDAAGNNVNYKLWYIHTTQAVSNYVYFNITFKNKPKNN